VDLGEDVTQVLVRLETLELRRVDQRIQIRIAVRSAYRIAEEPIAPPQAKGANRVFDRIRVNAVSPIRAACVFHGCLSLGPRVGGHAFQSMPVTESVR